jgi:hypothetical protein
MKTKKAKTLTEQASIKGLQTYPKRKLVTDEGRTQLSEADFVQHHKLLFPGDPIPELTPPWYNPDFARVKYVRLHIAEECPAIAEFKRFTNRP